MCVAHICVAPPPLSKAATPCGMLGSSGGHGHYHGQASSSSHARRRRETQSTPSSPTRGHHRGSSKESAQCTCSAAATMSPEQQLNLSLLQRYQYARGTCAGGLFSFSKYPSFFYTSVLSMVLFWFLNFLSLSPWHDLWVSLLGFHLLLNWDGCMSMIHGWAVTSTKWELTMFLNPKSSHSFSLPRTEETWLYINNTITNDLEKTEIQLDITPLNYNVS